MVGGYLVAAMACSALLIRVRPEWMMNEDHKLPDADPRRWFRTDKERRDYAEWKRYSALHADDLQALMWTLGRRCGAAEPQKAAGASYNGLSEQGKAVCLLAPIVVVGVLPFSVVTRAATASLNKKTKLRAELAAEAAATMKEVDELLR